MHYLEAECYIEGTEELCKAGYFNNLKNKKMITEQDLKLAYHRDTGHNWENKTSSEREPWLIEKLLNYENNLAEYINEEN